MTAQNAMLRGRRVVVVGGSEGIGREVVLRTVAAGAEVVFGGRRLDALEAVAETAGGGHPVAVDVTDDVSIERFVSEAGAHLGRIDMVFSTAGSASLCRLAASDRETWQRTLAVNVVGFNQLARALLPLLAERAIVVALSSESAAAPRDGLVAYAASKAALEVSIRGWRYEHPEVRWSCAVVGATFPTQFGATFEPREIGKTLRAWTRRGLMQTEFMEPGEVADALLGIYVPLLAAPSVAIEDVVLRSPSPVAGD